MECVEQIWPMYFDGDAISVGDERHTAVQALVEYYQKHYSVEDLATQLRHQRHVILDVEKEESNLPLQNFVQLLRDEPIAVLACMALAVHAILMNANQLTHPKVIIRAVNFASPLPMAKLKSSVVERFVCLRGTVVRVSTIQPLVISILFRCARCGSEINRTFAAGRYDPPTSCASEQCKARSLEPDRSTAKAIDFQRIRIQEIQSEKIGEAGHVPRTIEIELTNDLVDQCQPGDIIRVVGTVKALKTEVSSSRSSKQSTCLFVLFVEANSLVNERTNSSSMMQMQQRNTFTLPQLHAIQAIHEHEDVFSLIVNSLCPSIFGHELVKAGLCLSAFGGCRKNIGDAHMVPIRGDIHVLVVGDPGLGKSQMMRGLARVVPRAVYVCGNSSTTSGLTVTMVREAGGDYALEAGALVLADDGICCIDELDKMSADYQALLEAMEQQSISIAKAGVVCTLSARTSVVAAANPVGGHYNRSKTVNENLKMSAALLSRFDLIFILLDSPNTTRDELISEHVIRMHSTPIQQQMNMNASSYVASPSTSTPLRPPDLNLEQSIGSRLSLTERQRADFCAIPAPLLRAYIAYSRQYVRPRLSDEAKRVLCQFYMTLRRNHHDADGTPITTRQIESLIRMAEARARIELREVVTEHDANDVVEIMKESLYDVFADESGACDFGRSRGQSKANACSSFMKALHVEARARGSSIFTMEEMHDIALRQRIQIENFHSFIDNLNQQNLLLCKGRKTYRVMGTNFD